ADRHVRLDFMKLLTPGALTPMTDNPDERAFLTKVRHTLVATGVWLRFDQQLVRDPRDPSRWMVDPRTFQASLSLGYGGPAIPTKGGLLTRDALIYWTFGVGYYEQVVKGRVQSALDDAIKQVAAEILHGEILHENWITNRVLAAPGVVWVSDKLGG